MEKKRTRNSLQKELEFYTNLLAQHENTKKGSCNLPSTSSSNLSIQKPDSSNIYHSYGKNKTLNLYKLHKPDLKTSNTTLKNPCVIDKFSNKNNTSLLFSQSSKLLPTKQIKKSAEILKSTSAECHLNSFQYDLNKCKSKTFVNISNGNVKTNFKKPLVNKEVPSKSDSKKLIGEIMAITEKLKIKTESCKSVRNPSTSLQPLKDANKYKNKEVVAKISKTVNLSKPEESNSIKLNESSKVKNGCTMESAVNKEYVLPAPSNTIIQNMALPSVQSLVLSAIPSKINSKLHLLKELDAVEKILAEKNKRTTKTLLKARPHSLKCKIKINNKCLNNRTTPSPKVTISYHKHYLLKKNMPNKFSKYFSPGKSIMQNDSINCTSKQISKRKLLSNKTNNSSPRVNVSKTKYKLINKKESQVTSKKLVSTSLTRNKIHSHGYTNITKNSFISINSSPTNSAYYSKTRKTSKSFSKTCSVKRVSSGNSPFYQNMRYQLKKTPATLFNKSNLHSSKSVAKQKPDLNLTEFSQSPSDIDVDLLLELAEENKSKLLLSVPRKRLFKSKSRLINRNATQAKAVKMIKAKYFSSYRKPTVWKNNVSFSKSCKAFQKNYMSSSFKGRNNYQNRLESRKRSHYKKIVNLSGEQFIVGTTGRTLKKLSNQGVKQRKIFDQKNSFKWKTAVKTPTPVSKIMASRALNRSITQALSASAKKKMQKINKYCMFYNRFGRCNKGVKCSFVHDPSKIAVCTRFLRGTCKSENCLFSHEINPGKMAICTFFLQDNCTKKNCPYRHEKPSSQAEVCKEFVQGYCSHGKDCKKAHVLICSKFLRGVCDKGKDCIFPHPDRKNSSKPSQDNQKKDEFLLETVLRYYESSPKESLTKDLVVPKRKTIPEQPSFISLTMNESS